MKNCNDNSSEKDAQTMVGLIGVSVDKVRHVEDPDLSQFVILDCKDASSATAVRKAIKTFLKKDLIKRIDKQVKQVTFKKGKTTSPLNVLQSINSDLVLLNELVRRKM